MIGFRKINGKGQMTGPQQLRADLGIAKPGGAVGLDDHLRAVNDARTALGGRVKGLDAKVWRCLLVGDKLGPAPSGALSAGRITTGARCRSG